VQKPKDHFFPNALMIFKKFALSPLPGKLTVFIYGGAHIFSSLASGLWGTGGNPQRKKGNNRKTA